MNVMLMVNLAGDIQASLIVAKSVANLKDGSRLEIFICL